MTDSITNEFLKYKNVISSLLTKIRPRASRQDIEDVLQDTYINTYQSSLKQDISFPKSFMVKTAIRLATRQSEVAQRYDCDDAIEQHSDAGAEEYDTNEFSSRTEQTVLNREDFSLLCEAVSELPVQCRRVFILKKVYGLSQQEIAEKLSISTSTVEKHVAKGLLRTITFFTARQEQETRKSASVHELRTAKSGRPGK